MNLVIIIVQRIMNSRNILSYVNKYYKYFLKGNFHLEKEFLFPSNIEILKYLFRFNIRYNFLI